MDRTSRILRLIALLQAEAWNTQQLAQRLNVGRRTVFRDLQLLRANGFLITFDGERKSYRLTGSQLRDNCDTLRRD